MYVHSWDNLACSSKIALQDYSNSSSHELPLPHKKINIINSRFRDHAPLGASSAVSVYPTSVASNATELEFGKEIKIVSRAAFYSLAHGTSRLTELAYAR